MKKLCFILSIVIILANANMCYDENMRDFLKTINSQGLPLKIDNITYLTKVECKNNTIFYLYELDFNSIDKRITSNSQMKDLMQRAIRANNKELYCKSNLISWHRENNIAMQWIYMLDNREFLNVKMSVNDCEKEEDAKFYQSK